MSTTARILVLFCGLALAAGIVLPLPLRDKLFAIAYGIDPQRPLHSYFLGGVQLPLEARKVGMFGGFLVTWLYLLALGRQRAASFPPPRLLATALSFVALMGLDGLNATFYDVGWPHLYAPDLRLRLATGLLTGIAMAIVLLPAINGSIWREIDLVPSLGSAKELAGALLLAAILFVAVDARLPILYYPIAILGVAGLVVEIALINVIFVLVLGRRVGAAQTTRDVLPAAAAGLILCALELAVMSVFHLVFLGNLAAAM